MDSRRHAVFITVAALIAATAGGHYVHGKKYGESSSSSIAPSSTGVHENLTRTIAIKPSVFTTRAENSTPIMATSSTPVVATSSTPVMATSSTPVMATSSTPVMATSSTPIMAMNSITVVGTPPIITPAGISTPAPPVSTSYADSASIQGTLSSMTVLASATRPSTTPSPVAPPAGVNVTVFSVKVALIAACNGILLLIFSALILALVLIKVQQHKARSRARKCVEESRNSMMDNPIYGVVVTLDTPPEPPADRDAGGEDTGEGEELEATSESDRERELVNPLYGSAQDYTHPPTLEEHSEREVINPIYGDAVEMGVYVAPCPSATEKARNGTRNHMLHQHSCPEKNSVETEPVRPRRHSSYSLYENYTGLSLMHSSLNRIDRPPIEQGNRCTGKKPAVLPRKIVNASSEKSMAKKPAGESIQLKRPGGVAQEGDSVKRITPNSQSR